MFVIIHNAILFSNIDMIKDVDNQPKILFISSLTTFPSLVKIDPIMEATLYTVAPIIALAIFNAPATRLITVYRTPCLTMT